MNTQCEQSVNRQTSTDKTNYNHDDGIIYHFPAITNDNVITRLQSDSRKHTNIYLHKNNKDSSLHHFICPGHTARCHYHLIFSRTIIHHSPHTNIYSTNISISSIKQCQALFMASALHWFLSCWLQLNQEKLEGKIQELWVMMCTCWSDGCNLYFYFRRFKTIELTMTHNVWTIKLGPADNPDQHSSAIAWSFNQPTKNECLACHRLKNYDVKLHTFYLNLIIR